MKVFLFIVVSIYQVVEWFDFIFSHEFLSSDHFVLYFLKGRFISGLYSLDLHFRSNTIIHNNRLLLSLND
jgi:hypothetical protein